ncbi:MAG TPA: MraY family glycosyltransferase, partial [bacterium]|nr:MraY family glycosyltransferase [bacterium]
CLISAAVFGMTLGFLRFNFHPARIFMGDMGSLTLGFVLAAIGVMGDRKSSTALPLLIPLIALGVAILDTAMAIVRRLGRGAHVFQADREHLHHRLMALGLSHRQTVLLIYYFCAYLSVSALVLSGLATRQTVLVLIVLAMGLFLAMMALEFIERKAKTVSSVQLPCSTLGSHIHENGNTGGRTAGNKLLFPRLRTGQYRGRHRPGRRRGAYLGSSRTRRR